MSTLIRVVDCETTGIPPDAAACEVAACDLVARADGGWERSPVRSALVDPERFIPVEAMAIHHITDADVRGKLKLADVAEMLDPGPGAILAAFNAPFERFFLDAILPGERRWICVYRVAVVLWPDSPRHSNQVLRYYLDLKLDPALASPPHRAGPDAYVTAALLARALKRMTIEQMLEVSDKPVLLPWVTFGMHEGIRWEDVPSGYMRWCLDQAMDEDVRHTCSFWLEQREARRRGMTS